MWKEFRVGENPGRSDTPVPRIGTCPVWSDRIVEPTTHFIPQNRTRSTTQYPLPNRSLCVKLPLVKCALSVLAHRAEAALLRAVKRLKSAGRG